jgi:hypothetical protein
VQLILDIPDDLAAALRASLGDDLGRAALERFALDGYQAGTLSRYQVQRLLGFDNRWNVEEWLGARGANLQYRLADLEQDRVTLDHILGLAGAN